MLNEFAEPCCPNWVGTAGFTNPSQQLCTRSWGFHRVPADIFPADNCFRPWFVRVVDV